MIFNLSFYQKEAVKDNYIACNYMTYITDSVGNEVSDRQKLLRIKQVLYLKIENLNAYLI